MEQGLGDMLQFVRFVRLAKERGGRVMVECPGFLAPLLSRCEGIDGIVIEGEALPDFDLQIPVMSLPLALGITLGSLPGRVPYVFVEEGREVWWREWVEGERAEEAKGIGLAGPVDGVEETGTGTSSTRSQSPFLLGQSQLIANQSPFLLGQSSSMSDVFRVGIVWQGNPNHRLDRYRSIALREFGVLAGIPGVKLVSLQRGPGAAQIRQVGSEFSVLEPPHSERMTAEDLLDTAALMKCLDLVIAVDTGAAHLAGALGVPVWVPLSAIGEWRWLLHREDSPWYPTMRLFRQKKLGKWGPVFRRMAVELERVIGAR
jgi:hypothetical protein